MVSQEIEVVTGLSNPLGIALNGNDLFIYLFICEHSVGGTSYGIISKADLSDDNPIKENLVTGIFYQRAICLVGNELYYATVNCLLKMNITDSEPNPINVTGMSYIYALAIIDNYLYIGNYENKIYRIDTNNSSSPIEVVLDNIED